MPSSDSGWIDPVREALREHERERGDLQPPAAAPLRIDRYDVRELLGEGAVGVVYRAHDRQLNRDVALKVLREVVGSDTSVRERFQREARVAAVVSHPNLVTVYDVGQQDGQLYLVMELVEGRPLTEVLVGRRGDLRFLAGLLSKVARGVEAIHGKGIVHRDLKPGNILVTAGGEPKVGDFGIAHVAGSQAGLTKTGAIVGTPLYMAPEQVRGRRGDMGPAIDVYALGAILYEMLAGRPPHLGETLTEIYGRIVSSDPVSPRRLNPSTPADLENIALKALEKEPERRYATAAAFGAELDRWLAGEPVLAKPPGPWRRAVKSIRRRPVLAAVTTVVLLAASAAIVQRQRLGLRDAQTAEALRLLEDARPALEKSRRYLYRPDGDYAAVLREVDASRSLAEEALRLAPELPMAHYLLGRARDTVGWEAGAEASWREAIRLKPNFGAAHYQLGRLLMIRSFLVHTNQGLEAAKRKEQGERLAREGAAELERAGVLESPLENTLAGMLISYSRKDGGLGLQIEQALGRFDGEEGAEEIHWLKGVVLRDPEEKLRSFGEALRRRPRYPLALVCRGGEHLKAMRIDDARADFDLAIATAPRFIHALSMRALIWWQRQDWNAAIADADAILAIEPRQVDALISRALARFQKEDYTGSIADTTSALEVNPALVKALALRGSARSELGRTDEALADAAAAIALEPDNPDLHRYRGSTHAKAEHWDAAARDFEEALRLAPESWAPRAETQRQLEGAREQARRTR